MWGCIRVYYKLEKFIQFFFFSITMAFILVLALFIVHVILQFYLMFQFYLGGTKDMS